jgi:RNA ligase
MKYEIEAFEVLVKDGYLKRAEKGDLVLYGYTDKTTFERAWQTKYTRDARGIILNKNTGEVVAKTFKKFFNLNEMEETQLKNLPNEQYEVFEKYDGSMGTAFFHDNDWHMATRGSFTSEQALRGLAILNKNYNISRLDPNCTYLVEIIYPENKIIVDYGDKEMLVLLGVFHVPTGDELSFQTVRCIAQVTGMPCAVQYFHTIEQMIELQKTMPKDEEGFVVRFESGLRVKIKGEEYMKIAKMISQMSPISFWESMENGKVKKDYLQQLPEEFRKEYEPMVERLESLYEKTLFEIATEQTKLPITELKDRNDRKNLGLYLSSGKHDLKHASVMFAVVLKQWETVNSYIMKLIRPTGNVLS